MGIVTIYEDGGTVVKERSMTTCHVCGATIEYESRPRGNFLRRYRIYKRRLPNGHVQSEKFGGGEYNCNYHNKILCIWCARYSQTAGRCIAMEQIAEATFTAIVQRVNIWTPQGQHYVEVLTKKRIYLTS